MITETKPLALVTGGARGYGLYAVRELARRGMRVAVLGRSANAVEAICTEVNGFGIRADVLDLAALRDGVTALTSSHGPVEILVNNAGLGGVFDLSWEADPDDWWRTVEVNVRGTHNVSAVVAPSMIAAGRGRIINIVSHAGMHRWPLNSTYSVSKAAVIKHGENLAAELRRFGVSVLNYHPGILSVGLTETLNDGRELTANEQLVANWFRQQFAAGRGVDVDVSTEKLARIASGELDALSGRYVTAYDDLDELLVAAERIARSDALTMGLVPLPD